MAKSLNRVTLLGNLGKDPELRTTQSGVSVCSFSVATTESYKDQSGEWKENTDWHNVVIWNKLAEVAAQYLKKGNKIYLEGKVKTRSYEKDGTTRYITEIVVNNMIMLGGREQGEGGSFNSGGQSFSQQAPQQAAAQTSSKVSEHVLGEDDFSDEVPF